MPHPKPAKSRIRERERLDARLPSDTTRPVYTAIRATFIDAFSRFYILLSKMAVKSMSKKFLDHPERLSKDAHETDRLDEQCTKLAALLFPTSDSGLVFRARLWDSQMGARDCRDADIVKFLRRHLKRWRQGRGQPVKLQPIGLRALELRIIDQRCWSWNEIAKKLCRCGAEKHGFRCRENIRREMYLVRELLKNLQVKLPPVK